jgi:hypothetical protein
MQYEPTHVLKKVADIDVRRYEPFFKKGSTGVNKVQTVLTSEFFWGILVGAPLTIVRAYIPFYLQTKRIKQIVRRFCQERRPKPV